MKIRILVPSLALGLIAASSALADGGYAPPAPPPRETKPNSPGGTQSDNNDNAPKKDLTPRERADRLYADAYDEVSDGKEEMKKGKEKSALKHFGKALEQCKEAVELDSTYYQAWNLIAYTSRKTGKVDDAFAAYAKCLALNPDFEIAHEYRGEAYLQIGNLPKAKEELSWLKAKGSEYRTELAEAIATYEKAKAATPPDSSAAAKK